MITGDECGPIFLTFVLQLRANPGKNLNQEIDLIRFEPGLAAGDATMLRMLSPHMLFVKVEFTPLFYIDKILNGVTEMYDQINLINTVRKHVTSRNELATIHNH